MSSADQPGNASDQESGSGARNLKNTTTSRTSLFTWLVVGYELLRVAVSALASIFHSPAAAEVNATQTSEENGRAADRTLDDSARLKTHAGWKTVFVCCAYTLALAGGVGYLVAYWNFDKVHWNAGNNFVLGGALAVFFAGLGCGAVLHTHWLMRHKQATEPRKALPSSGEEREAALEAYEEGLEDIRRRALLVGVGVTGVGIFGAIFVSMMRSMETPPAPTVFSTVWKRGQRLVKLNGAPVSVDSLQPGDTVVVFPEDKIGFEHAQTVLIRVREQDLHLPQERTHWAPMGYVAYSRVCTHAGCAVGMFEATTDLLMCPCHQSTFDVLRAARPTGGPAARPLPQLPLYADEKGMLRAAGGFSEPPGPGFWGMP